MADKLIRIISHTPCEEPGYLCEYLCRHGINFENISIEPDCTLPTGIDDISGLVILGSPFSVNNVYPWINDELTLVKLAQQYDVPVLGICFGAQLVARAMGGEVSSAHSMQIGWHPVTFTEQARLLLGANALPNTFEAFEWHGDTFSIPHDVIPLFTGTCIKNQGFIYKNCLALQFHPEITVTMVYEWIDRYAHCLEINNECIQSKSQIFENFTQRLEVQRLVADQLFQWWLNRVSEYIANSVE